MSTEGIGAFIEFLLFMKFILSALIFSYLAASSAYAIDSFKPIQTIDGVPVFYKGFQDNPFEVKVSSPAVAVYDEHGAFIFYDEKVIDSISDLGKYLILEHERAHHHLGHTLFTKMRRELQLGMPPFYESQKEKDADCEAGYRMKEELGDISREAIKSAMSEIYYALEGSEGTPLPSWLLSRIDRIDLCKDGKLLKRPKPVMDASEIFAKKSEGLSSKPLKRHHGPNCWNSALYMSQLSHQVRFVSQNEFHHLMESGYCQTLERPEEGAIKVYRADLNEVIGAAREIHAALWVSEEEAFNKMTALSTSGYKLESHDVVDQKYRWLSPSVRFSIQDETGKWGSVHCPQDKCENEILYKKCQDLSVIEAQIGRHDYRAIYDDILMIESKIASHLFNTRVIPKAQKAIFEAELLRINSVLEQLPSPQSFDKWQLQYFKYIVESLQTQLSMRQPNWLSE